MDRKKISKLVREHLAQSADQITDIVLDAVREELVGSLQDQKPARKRKSKAKEGVVLLTSSDIRKFNNKRWLKARNALASHN